MSKQYRQTFLVLFGLLTLLIEAANIALILTNQIKAVTFIVMLPLGIFMAMLIAFCVAFLAE
jgi:hypothetical protein